jgi:hypothetical protein
MWFQNHSTRRTRKENLKISLQNISILISITNLTKFRLSKYIYSTLTTFISCLILLLFIGCSTLSALNIDADIGFSIPLGSWSEYHKSAQFVSFRLEPVINNYANLGLFFETSTFTGKLNDSYNLQFFSPGINIKFFPLFFRNNKTLIVNCALSYCFMERKLHKSNEKGHDYGITATTGLRIKITNNWYIIPFAGERHIMGGLDMLIFGTTLGFSK